MTSLEPPLSSLSALKQFLRTEYRGLIPPLANPGEPYRARRVISCRGRSNRRSKSSCRSARAPRHTPRTTSRLQTLEGGAPVSPWTVEKELGHTSRDMLEEVYGRLGEVRHRSEAVEYRVGQHFDWDGPLCRVATGTARRVTREPGREAVTFLVTNDPARVSAGQPSGAGKSLSYAGGRSSASGSGASQAGRRRFESGRPLIGRSSPAATWLSAGFFVPSAPSLATVGVRASADRLRDALCRHFANPRQTGTLR
jgi:hypothetical protein